MPSVSVSRMKQKHLPKPPIGNVAACCNFLVIPPQKGIDYVHVLHTASQTRLKSSRMPSEDPHHRCPAQTRKDRPRIALHLFSQFLANPRAPLTSSLNGQLCKCKHDSGENVYDDLLVDAALYATSKDGIAAY